MIFIYTFLTLISILSVIKVDSNSMNYPPNEYTIVCKDEFMYSPCAYPCQPTCDDPNRKPCRDVECTPGCVCFQDNYVKYVLEKEGGKCIPIQSCPKKPGPTPLPTNEPQTPPQGFNSSCSQNETMQEYVNECGRNCKDFAKVKVMNQTINYESKGCTCKENYVRDSNTQKCVLPKDCSVKPECPPNQQYYPCGSCIGTCDEPDKICTDICREPGNCDCYPNFVRNEYNECIPRYKCFNKLQIGCADKSKKCGGMYGIQCCEEGERCQFEQRSISGYCHKDYIVLN